MRIKFNGRFTLEEVRNLLLSDLERLEAAGATHMQGVNFYFYITDNQGYECGYSVDDQVVDGWEHKSAHQRKTMLKETTGKNVKPLRLVSGGKVGQEDTP